MSDQQDRKKAATRATLDLSQEDITALDDVAVASLMQEALDEAVDSQATRLAAETPASTDDDSPVDAQELIPIDLAPPMDLDAEGLALLSGDAGMMLPEEDPALAFPDQVYDEPGDGPPEPKIPDEILEELQLLRERIDVLTDAEQAALIEHRSQLDSIESQRAQLDVYKGRLVKLHDEFEAYRKRVERDRAEQVRRETERVLREILPVVDHMELALEHARATPSGKGLLEGFELILDQFRKALAGLGVETIAVEPSHPFDPGLHEAVMRETVEDMEPNRVSRTLRTGYLLGDRLLRAARVAVATDPATGDEQDVPTVEEPDGADAVPEDDDGGARSGSEPADEDSPAEDAQDAEDAEDAGDAESAPESPPEDAVPSGAREGDKKHTNTGDGEEGMPGTGNAASKED